MPRRKRTDYAVAVDGAGRATAEDGEPQELGEAWTPEHLVLAALARCVLTSLRYHARRDEVAVSATANAAGGVFERPDGRWGFVEIACTIDATVDPAPEADALRELRARAERGCFVGASLDPAPAYTWRINGAEID